MACAGSGLLFGGIACAGLRLFYQFCPSEKEEWFNMSGTW
jgi:hypothetical protein